MRIGTIESAGGTQTVSVDNTKIAVLVALIAAIPPGINALIEHGIKPRLASVESEKVELERDKATTAALQSALANPNAAERQLLIQLLGTAGVLESEIASLPAAQLPHWPPAAAP